MEALYILLIFSLILGVTFLMAFFWAQRDGQFEDAETPAIRMLFDDKPVTPKTFKQNHKKEHQGDYHGS